MVAFSREAQSMSLSFISLTRPFSNFQYIDQEYGEFPSLRRIMSQVRAHEGTTMIVEEVDPFSSDDLRQENEDLIKLHGLDFSSSVHRLSFFKQSLSNISDLHKTSDLDFIGYAIVKRDIAGQFQKLRIFESVLLPSRRVNNFIHGSQRWSCLVGSLKFNVFGYVYAQQNGATNVCAHVACRTAAARFHTSGDMTYREMNDLPNVGIDHVQKTLEGRGLNARQMITVLEAAGARCIAWNYSHSRSGVLPPYQKVVYGSIESGYPAILVFATTKGVCHAIPVFGHTFNEDMWAPNADWSYFRVGAGTSYISSDSWLSTFLVHDDNWGSNYCVPPSFLSTKKPQQGLSHNNSPSTGPSDCLAHVIATLPRDVKGSPVEAELTGADFLLALLPRLSNLQQPWGQRLDSAIRQKRVVLRPLLIDRANYLEHLRNMQDWDHSRLSPDRREIITEALTEKVWMVEVSIPELFSSNRRKIGEVLLRTDKEFDPNQRFGNFIFARIPGYFVFLETDSVTAPEYVFSPSGLQGHVSLYGCGE